MIFFPHSAFEIPRQNNGMIDSNKASIDSFWEQVDSEYNNLSSGVGCYVFSIRAGKGTLPWYVGLAEKQSFRKECFTSHKLLHYNQAIVDRKGTPLLTLVAKYTNTDKIVSPTGNSHRDIQFLENLLIAQCLSKNKNLLNKKSTKLLKEMIVHGLLNTPPGKIHQSVSDFKSLIGS